MLRSIINVITVIIDTCAGLLSRKEKPDKVSISVMAEMDTCTCNIGISGSHAGDIVLILIASVMLDAINSFAERVETRLQKQSQERTRT